MKISAHSQGRIMEVVLFFILSLQASKDILYTKNIHIQPKLCPPEDILLIPCNHPTSIPLTWKRTRPRVWLVECLIIQMIFKQINHIKCERDTLVFWQLEHISIIINLPCHTKWSILELLQFCTSTRETTSMQMRNH